MFTKNIIQFIFIFLLGISLILTTCTSNTSTVATSQSDNVLRVWWNRGYYPEETEAIQKIINEWQKQSDIKVELTSYAEKDLAKATQNAVEDGGLPDILYNYSADWTLYPRYAWENRLVDVTDIVEPLKDWFSPIALESVYYKNRVTRKRSYYAIPFGEQSTYIHYWKDILKTGGLTEGDIPAQWDKFWKFWETTQNILNQNQSKALKSMGITSSQVATDTFCDFEHFLEAYNVKLIDEHGNLKIDDLKTKRGIIFALRQFSKIYKNGYTPLQVINWEDPDNNKAFLSREVLMTLNPSLSIPSSQRDDSELYYNKIGTVDWPQKTDGSPMTHLMSVKQAVIFSTSKKQRVAKDFLSFFVQPKNLAKYLKNNKGRYIPPMPKLLDNEFWNNQKDSHTKIAKLQLKHSRLFYQVFNPAYSEVNAQNVWGIAIRHINNDNWTPEKAADQAIAQITKIFADWT
jgi:multiple sugar transport system substrate-binding protein